MAEPGQFIDSYVLGLDPDIPGFGGPVFQCRQSSSLEVDGEEDEASEYRNWLVAS